MKPAACPNPEALKNFVRCAVSEVESDSISRHIESCPKCEETVVGLERNGDTVAQHIRQAVATPSFAQEPECRELMASMLERTSLSEPGAVAAAAATAMISPSVLPVIQNLRDYRIVAKLGEGGMGAVYKAVHQRLKKTVALKVLPTARIRDPQTVARFEREMSVLGQLNHPNIVQALDAGEQDGQHYLVMEYVEGSELSEIVKRRSPLSIADACRLVSQAAVGLQYAHENGFVHRDIKPSNLMLAKTGQRTGTSQVVVKILDLGLARALEQPTPRAAPTPELTTAGQVMGTLEYMAPEQGGDSHQVDIRADIYSLGATLYKLLTGDTPFAEHNHKPIMQRLMAVAQTEPPPIRSKRADVPEKLATVIHRMLAKQPDRRFATPQEVVEALEPYCVGADIAALLAPNGAPPVLDAPTRLAPSVIVLDEKLGTGRRTKSLLPGVAAILLLAVVMVISTKHGKVEVTSSNGELPADVKVAVSRNGEEVEVLQSDNHWSAKLVNGEYQVSLRVGDDKFELNDSKLTIRRMGRARVELALKREAVVSATKPNTEPVAPAKTTKPQVDQKPAPPVVAKAINDKPFSIERAGQKLRSFKSLVAGYDESQPGDILLVEGVASIEVKFPKVTKPLHLKTVGEHRPLLRLTNGTDGVPHSNYIDIDSELHFEGCDIDAGESTFVVRSQGELVVRGSRIWGGATDIGRATLSDSLLIAHSFSSGGFEAKACELSLENCLVRHLGLSFVAAVQGRCEFKMNRCTFHGRGGSLIAVPENCSVNVEAIGNLFDWDVGVLVTPSMHGPWHSMEGYKRVNWSGSGNCFAGRWFKEYELDENRQPVVKAQGLEAWNRLWKQPEQNSREIPAMSLELAKGSRLFAPERTSYLAKMIDGLRRQYSLAEIGPDMSLIGPGDAYVRALAAAGHPVSEDELRPERPEDGPVLLLRNDKLIKAYGQLEMAMQDAIDGDVMELRTDGTVAGGLTVGAGRRLTIRSAPGYRPIIDGLGEHNDRLSLEGLLLQGGILASGGYGTNDPEKPYASEGGFERIVNCSLVSPADNGQFIGGWLYPKNGPAPIVQNCDFSHIGFAVAPKTHATISNSILCWMRLTTIGTPESAGSMTFDRCLAWFPYVEHGLGGNVMTTSGTNQIQWNRSLLTAAFVPFSESAFANMGGFTGENNVFMISTNWMNHRFQRFRERFGVPLNGVEFPPLEFDLAQWRVSRELSPAYEPRPDGTDHGVDFDRLGKVFHPLRSPVPGMPPE